MTRGVLLLVGLIAALICVATVNAGKIAAHIPSQWILLNQEVPEKHDLRVRFYLKQQNMDKIFDLVKQVSDPESPHYGQYLTPDQIAMIVAPKREVIDFVLNAIAEMGGRDMQVDRVRDSIVFTISAEDASAHLGVDLKVFQNAKTGRQVVRSIVKEDLPASIQQHVDLVMGISSFSSLRRKGGNKYVKSPTVHEILASASAGVQNITRAAGIDGAVAVTFVVVCTNGQVSYNFTAPCADYGLPTLESVSLTFTPFTPHAPAATSTKPLMFGKDITCKADSDFGYTVCSVIGAGVTNYIPVNVALQATFDATTYAVSVFGSPVVPSPMVTTRTLQQLYKVPIGLKVTNPSATQAVVEFEEQYYDSADLDLFFKAMGLPSDLNVTIVGPNNTTNPGTEALLDIEYIMGLAPGSPTTFWSIPANSTAEIDDILQWATDMLNAANPPLVNSVSYGMSEANVDKYFGNGYLIRSDNELAKLALTGITVLIASGDTGAGDLGGPPMGWDNCNRLHPDWPSQSPYVTSVGATYISPLSSPICYASEATGGANCLSEPLAEVGVSVDGGMRWTSGGGFSDVVPTPWYQQDAVAQYLNRNNTGCTSCGASAQYNPLDWTLPPSNVFTSTGRAYPDVSAVGHNLLVSQNGAFFPVDGTSASAPIFAGIITLLNDARLNANLPPLGFLNPLLYTLVKQSPASFTDLVVGRNACGAIDSQPICCPFGFMATPGFDPVGGLGTPNFEALRDAVLRIGYAAKLKQQQNTFLRQNGF